MKRTIHLGASKHGNVFVFIGFTNGKLSISGVEGPKPNGDARGSCGQIEVQDDIRLNEGWTPDMLDMFKAVWKRWHLNDMRPGCEHQREARWAERPIDPAKPLSACGKHFEGQKNNSWNTLAWVTRKEHPKGLLGHPCPICGYQFGSRWIHEDVPKDVVEWLFNLPIGNQVPPAVWQRNSRNSDEELEP